MPDKYVAADNQIRLGKPEDATHGVQVLMGLKGTSLGAILQDPLVAIEREFEAHGGAEDKMVYIDVDACIACGACIPVCPYPEQALRSGPDHVPMVDESFCTGCGQCAEACRAFPKAIHVGPIQGTSDQSGGG